MGLAAVGGPIGLETHRLSSTEAPGHRRDQDELPPNAPGNAQGNNGQARGPEVVGQRALRGRAGVTVAPDRSGSGDRPRGGQYRRVERGRAPCRRAVRITGTARLAKAQRSLSSKQRGSAHRHRQVEVVARCHRKIANQRRNASHQLSRQLVNDYDFIALEDLTIKNMTRRPKPKPDPDSPGSYLPNGAARKAGLNRSIHDAGWGVLVSMILDKAECAGREVVTVRPHYTSQRCAECGHTEPSNRINQAEFRCCSCGHEDHADRNAARNILGAGRALRASARVGSD